MEKRPPTRQQQLDAANVPIGPASSGRPDYSKSNDEAPTKGGSIPNDTVIDKNYGEATTKHLNSKAESGMDKHSGVVGKAATSGGTGHASAPGEGKRRTRTKKTGGASLNIHTAPSKKATGKDMKKGSSKDERILPEGFKPKPYTVIIGRGKESKDHGASGNHRLKVLVSQHLSEYANAVNRTCMSKIVSSVVAQVREACSKEEGEEDDTSSAGAFVRLDKVNGRWYEVSDVVAREKVGYTFRDMLGGRYRSSSQYKVARKRQLRGERIVFPEEEEKEQKPSKKKRATRAFQTGQNAVSASQNSAPDQQASPLLQFSEESSPQECWSESISPHQMPPVGCVLLAGANTPGEFFATSSSSSNGSPTTPTTSNRAVSHEECSRGRRQHERQERGRTPSTTTSRTTISSLQPPSAVHSSSIDETFSMRHEERGEE